MPGAERAAALLLLAVGLVVRLLALLHHRVNSDEPQHLHIAWAWAQGLLPYRDVFDNHTPLFGLVMSPWLALAGERARIVVDMRFAMVPLVLAGLTATWLIARRLFSPRVAHWAVALAAVNPEFLRASVEYRTDQLWTAGWLGALAVLVGGRLSRGRALTAGLLLGVAAATSLKTSLLLVTLLASVLVTCALLTRRGVRLPLRGLALRGALLAAGLLVVPGAFAAYFAARGAWDPFLYGVLRHNLVPGLGLWQSAPLRPLLLLGAAPLLALLAAALLRHAPAPGLGARRAVVLVTTGLAHAAIEGFWPLVTRADLLPLLPVESVFLAALLLALPAALARRGPLPLARALAWVPALALAAETAAAATVEPVWRDHTGPQVAEMRQVLRLTRPGEPVMDVKGEAIFRSRPYYLAIETITEERFRLGLLRDDIPEHLIASGTPAVVEQYLDPLPPRARAFVEAHYLHVGWLRVLGVRLDPPAGSAGGRRPFTIEVPQRYALVGAASPPRGSLDGRPGAGPRALARGRHVYDAAPGEGPVAVVWADAVARGASPFAPWSLDR
jgi:hypothetical protein